MPPSEPDLVQPGRRRAWASWWIPGVALAIVAYGLVVAAADAREVWAIWRGSSWQPLVVAAGLALIGFVVRAFRWHSYIALAGTPAPLGISFLTYFVGLGMGVTPGKAAELVKVHSLHRRANVPLANGVAAFLMEKLGDALGILTLLVVSAATFWIKGVTTAAAVAIVAFLLVIAPTIRATTDRSMSRPGFAGKADRLVRRLLSSMRPLLRPAPLAAGVAAGSVAWLLETYGMFLIATGLGLDVSWGLCALAYAAGSIAGFLSFLPGGLGATDAGIAGVLIAGGFAPPEAVALTLGIRTVTLWWGVALGAIAFLVSFLLPGPEPGAENATPAVDAPSIRADPD